MSCKHFVLLNPRQIKLSNLSLSQRVLRIRFFSLSLILVEDSLKPVDRYVPVTTRFRTVVKTSPRHRHWLLVSQDLADVYEQQVGISGFRLSNLIMALCPFGAPPFRSFFTSSKDLRLMRKFASFMGLFLSVGMSSCETLAFLTWNERKRERNPISFTEQWKSSYFTRMVQFIPGNL